jgi:putative membrane protein
VKPLVRHLSVQRARDLFDSQAERAAKARRLAPPEHWLSARAERPPVQEQS